MRRNISFPAKFILLLLLIVAFLSNSGYLKAQTLNEDSLEKSVVDCNVNIYASSKEKGFFGSIGGIWSSDAGLVCKISTSINEMKIAFCTTFEGKSKKECVQGMGSMDKMTNRAANIFRNMV